MTLLSTLSFDRQRVYAALARRDLQRDPHHTQARRLRQALDRANDLALPLLRSRLAPIDITPVWPPLSDICHDMALCLCSDQLPWHIAQDSLLQSVLPAKSMAPAMDGSYSVERAPAPLAAQLQADRLFRLARQVPLARHPLDTTAILPGR